MRERATKQEIKEREEFIYAYAEEHKPVTVRQLFYAATVSKIVGITKDEAGYGKIQRIALQMRQKHTLPYNWIADYSRIVWGLDTYSNINEAAEEWEHNYRLDFWAQRQEKVEVWLEKSALASSLTPITKKYRVDLFPTAGFASEGFVEKAVRNAYELGKTKLYIYSLYDFDQAGKTAAKALQKALYRLTDYYSLDLEYRALGLDAAQITDWNIPTRPPKRKSSNDKLWPYSFAAELDAIPVATLRNHVEIMLEKHLPLNERRSLLDKEATQRARLRMALHDLYDH